MDLLITKKSTSVTKKLKFNSTVEIVLQNTAMVSLENHPIHLHGFGFYVLAQGSFNDAKKFNLVNPQIRNTIAVPVGGWAVISVSRIMIQVHLHTFRFILSVI